MSELTAAELVCEEAVLLPSREALALLNIGVLVPINLGLALNALTEGSNAMVTAAQLAALNQS